MEVSAKYSGIAGNRFGVYDPVFGGYAYYVPLVYAQSNGFNTTLYIQNGGLECSSVEIWFKAQDDCLRSRICEIFTLAPGETFQFDTNDCVGPDFLGNAWIRASQPMGIAVDLIGPDVLMTYIGEPSEINYTFDPGGAVFSQGNQVAFGPLLYSEYQGWDSGVQVQNMSSVTAAKVKVYFLDRSGGIITAEAPIHVSNVMLVDGDGVTRVGYRREEVTKRRPDGSTYTGTRSVRVSRKTGKEI